MLHVVKICIWEAIIKHLGTLLGQVSEGSTVAQLGPHAGVSHRMYSSIWQLTPYSSCTDSICMLYAGIHANMADFK